MSSLIKKAESAIGIELLKQQRDLSILLASTSDLMEGLKASLDAVLQISGLDSGGIYLFDETGQLLSLIVHRGLSDEFVRTVSRYEGDSDNVRLVKSGEPIYVLYDELAVKKNPVELNEGILSIAVIPMLDSNSVIGCMNLSSKVHRKISAIAKLAVETTAAQIGSAIARLRAKDTVRESEGHLRSLMESASGFAVYRLVSDESRPNKLRVLFVSPSVQGILGIPDPMQFESWFANIHPDDVDRIAEANLKAFETYRFDEQYRSFHAEKGEWRWIHAISNAAVDGNRWTGYVNGIIIDITQKK
jgi:PAS domain-containing protein